MTAVGELVARLRARGVTIEPDGGTLVVRPAAAVTPDEVVMLRRHKQELLALLRPAPAWVDLNPLAVRELLGAAPDEHDIAALRFEVLAAIRQLEVEIATGAIGSRPLLVSGVALGLLVDLGEVARLLRAGRRPSP